MPGIFAKLKSKLKSKHSKLFGRKETSNGAVHGHHPSSVPVHVSQIEANAPNLDSNIKIIQTHPEAIVAAGQENARDADYQTSNPVSQDNQDPSKQPHRGVNSRHFNMVYGFNSQGRPNPNFNSSMSNPDTRELNAMQQQDSRYPLMSTTRFVREDLDAASRSPNVSSPSTNAASLSPPVFGMSPAVRDGSSSAVYQDESSGRIRITSSDAGVNKNFVAKVQTQRGSQCTFGKRDGDDVVGGDSSEESEHGEDKADTDAARVEVPGSMTATAAEAATVEETIEDDTKAGQPLMNHEIPTEDEVTNEGPMAPTTDPEPKQEVERQVSTLPSQSVSDEPGASTVRRNMTLPRCPSSPEPADERMIENLDMEGEDEGYSEIAVPSTTQVVPSTTQVAPSTITTSDEEQEHGQQEQKALAAPSSKPYLSSSPFTKSLLRLDELMSDLDKYVSETVPSLGRRAFIVPVHDQLNDEGSTYDDLLDDYVRTLPRSSLKPTSRSQSQSQEPSFDSDVVRRRYLSRRGFGDIFSEEEENTDEKQDQDEGVADSSRKEEERQHLMEPHHLEHRRLTPDSGFMPSRPNTPLPTLEHEGTPHYHTSSSHDHHKSATGTRLMDEEHSYHNHHHDQVHYGSKHKHWWQKKDKKAKKEKKAKKMKHADMSYTKVVV